MCYIDPEPPIPDCTDESPCLCEFGGSPPGNPPDNNPPGQYPLGSGPGNWSYNPFNGGITFILPAYNPAKMSPAPSLVLYYNNQNSDDYGLGPGWSHTYLSKLTVVDEKATIKKPSGMSRHYSLQNNNYIAINPADKIKLQEIQGGGYQAIKRDGEKWIYDNNGKLISIEDANGKALTLTYSGALLNSVVDDYGRELQFHYNAQGKLESVTDPLTRSTGYQFVYDQSNRLSQITSPEGRELNFVYGEESNDATNLTTVKEGSNTIIAEFRYNDNDQCIRHNAYHNGDDYNYRRDISYVGIGTEISEADEDFEDPDDDWDVLSAKGWTRTFTTGQSSVDFATDSTQGTIVELQGNKNNLAQLKAEFPGRQKIVAEFKIKRVSSKWCEIRLWKANTVGNIQLTIDGTGKFTYWYASQQLNGSTCDNYLKQLPVLFDSDHTQVVCSPGVWHRYRIIADTKVSNLSADPDCDNPKQFFELDEYVNGAWKKCSNLLFQRSGEGLPALIDEIDRIGFRSPDATDAGESHFYVDDVKIGEANSATREIMDSNGNISYFRFENTLDAGYELTKEGCTSCGGSTRIYTYDEDFNNTQIIDANGNKTTMTYDAGNMLTKTDAVGEDEQITTTYTGYHPDLHKPFSVKKPSVIQGDKETIYDYDSDHNTTYNQSSTPNLGQLVEIGKTRHADGTTVAYTYTTKYTYNTDGHVTLVEGPWDGVDDNIEFTYYANESGQGNNRGSLHTVTYPYTDPTPTYIYEDYDANHNVGKITDPNGVATEYTYDSMNRVKTVTVNPGDDQAQTEYFYDNAGKINYVLMPESNRVYYGYDSVGRISGITLTDSSQVAKAALHYEYDTEGNKTKEEYRDPAQSPTVRKYLEFQYDALNRLQKILKPNEQTHHTEFTYDGNGNLTQMTDPLEIITGYTSYDPLNRLKTVKQAKDTSDQAITNYVYDKHNNLTQVTDAENRVTTYEYDDMGRVVESESSYTGITRYVYDEAGNLITKVEGDGTSLERLIQYDYDAANRLVEIEYPNDTDVTFTYDNSETGRNGIGRLTTMTDASGVTNYYYDARGNITRDKKTIDSTDYAVDYTYNLNNTVIKTTYRSTGQNAREVVYTIDNATQRPTAIKPCPTCSSVGSGILYEPFGPMRSVTLGNNITTDTTFDQKYQVQAIDSGSILNRDYTYDDNGNITYINRNSATHDQPPIYPYSYTDNYAYGTSQPPDCYMPIDITNNQEPHASYCSDALGNVTNKQEHDVYGALIREITLTWNDDNRLTEVKDGTDTTIATYAYNGLGQRVKKEVGSDTTIFLYDLQGNIISEMRDGSYDDYLYLEGKQRLAKITNTLGTDAVYYYHNDHLGTPLAMTDSSGAVVWKARYKTFGEAQVDSSSTITNNFRFPGQYYDEETGLHYNYHRYYDPGTGRYISKDPIGFRGGINLYSYTDSNPINRVDPTGLAWVWYCKRRLSWSTSPLVWSLFPFFGHCYTKFGDEPLGFYNDGSGTWTIYDERTPGTSTNEGGERAPFINRWCRPSWVSDCEYNCLRSKMQVGAQGAPVTADSLSNNCCTNLDNVRKECKEKCCGK